MTIRKFSASLSLIFAPFVFTTNAQYTPLGSPTPTPVPTVQQPSRSVMVNSNSGLLIYPTNFWSANASNARVGLGATAVGSALFTSSDTASARATLSLGSAATSPSSAFQPSSATLSNLSANNGINLTNLQASNIVGLSAPTNITGIVAVTSGGTGATNSAAARINLGLGWPALTNTNAATSLLGLATNGQVVANTGTLTFTNTEVRLSPVVFIGTNFASIGAGGDFISMTDANGNTVFLANTNLVTFYDALAFNNTTNAATTRSNLGLGTAATNPSTAFQPASSTLTNLASGNGGVLTNLRATNIVGVIPSSNLPTAVVTNITGVLAVNSGGTGATNASAARTNLGFTAVGDAVGTATNAAAARIALGATSLGNSLFTVADAAAARSSLSLGTAATSPASAFQSASLVLSNLSISNAAGLTNISAAGVVGTVALASNITGTAPLATNVTGVVGLANGGTGATNASSARSALGATTVGANILTLPNPGAIRFLQLNSNNTVSTLSAEDFRTAIAVGTGSGSVVSVGMSVPNIFNLSTSTITTSGTFALSLANQTSRQFFSAPSGGGAPAFRAIESADLPSLAISNVSGLQTALDGKLSTSGSVAFATNVTGVVGLANGGTGGTNAASARTSLGATTVGANLFTLANPSAVRFLRINTNNTVSALVDSDFRTAVGLGSAATQPTTAFQPASTILSNLASGNGSGLTSVAGSNVTGSVPLASNVSGIVALANGGTGGTNAASARTNLGLSQFSVSVDNWAEMRDNGNLRLQTKDNVDLYAPLRFVGTNSSGLVNQSRTNLGLGWSALTNINAATSLLGYTSNGSVVAPNITFTSNVAIHDIGFTTYGGGTMLQADGNDVFDVSSGIFVSSISFASPVSFGDSNTTGATRTNLRLGATNNVTFNTIRAQQNASSGVFTLTLGPTNTGIRGVGGGPSDLVYTREGTNMLAFLGTGLESYAAHGFAGPVTLRHGSGNTGVLQFSGITAATGAAISRTNLGLGATWLTNTDVTNFRSAVGLGPSSNVRFSSVDADVLQAGGGFTIDMVSGGVADGTNQLFGFGGSWYLPVEFQSNITVRGNIVFSGSNSAILFGTNNSSGAATIRTNLELGTTNRVTFGSIRASTTATTNTYTLMIGQTNTGFRGVGAGVDDFGYYRSGELIWYVASSNLTVNRGIAFANSAASTTRSNLGLGWGPLQSTNAADFQSLVFSTNTAPANTSTVNSWMQIQIGTNTFRVPLYK